MEEKLVIPILFFFIVALGGICLLIFYFRKNDDSMYDWKMVTKYSELMREQTEENLDVLSKMNKEKEISNKIKMLNEQIERLEYKDKQNKDISKRLKDIEKIINEEEQPMEMFDDVIFENLVEKIIIGEQDRDGNINPNTIRFVLKIGTEYKFKDLSFVSNKKIRTI